MTSAVGRRLKYKKSPRFVVIFGPLGLHYLKRARLSLAEPTGMLGKIRFEIGVLGCIHLPNRKYHRNSGNKFTVCQWVHSKLASGRELLQAIMIRDRDSGISENFGVLVGGPGWRPCSAYLSLFSLVFSPSHRRLQYCAKCSL